MFDYVVVGAGSAGCVLARRLSDDPSASVCLLEAGGRDRSPLIHVPAGIAAILPTRHANWAFKTVPQKGLNNRQGYQPRGKTLGGSSSINAMIYIRGHRSDYDRWAELGNDGWSYEEVLPYFKKAENQERGGDQYHGIDGPLNVADLRSANPFTRVFIEAAKHLQMRETHDFNGAQQEGVGTYQVTQKNGRRCSAAKAYLAPIAGRPNLTIVTNAQATGLLFEDKRAVGATYATKGKLFNVRAKREVIVSCGSLQSPQLLMLSGVGPAEELERHGIRVLHDLPGVGQNLQDHIDYVTAYKTKNLDLFGFSASGALRMTKEIFSFLRHGRGMLTSCFAEAGGFITSRPDLEIPDLQLHFVVGIVDDHNRKLHSGHGYSCHVCLLRPKSRGQVTLSGAYPLLPPAIDPNFFGEGEDLEVMVRGFKIMREVLGSPPFTAYPREELYAANARTDEQIRAVIRERADTIYHPIGTCKMGNDEMAVVDDKLRVHGLKGLRVVDASIMPTLIGGNTNAPTIMIGEKGAELIRQTQQ